MIHHLTRATRHLVFWSLIVLAIGMTGLRLALTGVESYKAKLAEHIGKLLETPVTIGRLSATMRGFSPELILSDIAIGSAVTGEHREINLRQIRLGIHLLDIAVNRDLLSSSWLTLVGAKLSVIRKADGSIAVIGLKAGDEKPLWLLQGGRYEMLDSEISWQDESRSGGNAMVFDSVDLALINDGKRHRINALLQLPETYGDRLKISLDVSGNLFDSAAIDGKVYIEGHQLHLPALLNEELPMAVNVKSGVVDVQVWSEWRRSEWESLIVSVQADKLGLYRKDAGVLTAEHLKSRFTVRRSDNLWRLDVKQFLLTTPKIDNNGFIDWPDAVFSLANAANNDDYSAAYAGFIGQLDLQEASALASFFLPVEDDAKFLRQLDIKGKVDHVAWYVQPGQKRIAVNGNFAELGFASVASLPGLSHVSGHIRGDDSRGVLRLDSRAAELQSHLFRKPLSVDRLVATVGWRRKFDRWLFTAPLIEIDSLSLKSQSRLRLQLTKNGDQNFIDLQSTFSVDDASQANRYWPVRIMDAETVDWLDKAFVKGRVTAGDLLLYGNPADFPFSDGSGVFEIDFDVAGMEMAYDPSWPHLVDVDANALFYGKSMNVSVAKGRSRETSIKQAEVTIPDLSENAVLRVNGEADASIDEALAFLQQTPLHAPVDKVVGVIGTEGNTQVKLDLTIPLVTDDAVRVDGSAQLNAAKIRVKPLNLPVTEINGQIRFDADGLYSEPINARALGYPIQVDIDNSGFNTEINVSGRTDVEKLQQHFQMPWWHLAKGSTDYMLQLSLPADGSTPELLVSSDLYGIELNLPSFLNKSSEQKKKLSMTFQVQDQPLLPITLSYDNRLQAALKMNIAEQRLYSGQLLIGDGTVEHRQEPGLELVVHTAGELDLQDWLSFSPDSKVMASGVQELKKFELHIGEALWRKTRLGKLELLLEKKDGGWLGNIGGQLAKGGVRLTTSARDPAGFIRLDFDRLELSALKRFTAFEHEPSRFLDPNAVPLVTLISKQTFWQSVPLGAMTLETERELDGIAIKRLDLVGSEQKLTMSGDWKILGKESLTQTRGRLELMKGGHLFAKLGISKDLTETDGTFDFSLNWQAAPHQFDLERLQGQLDVNLKSGRILSIEPGFGRVLGILAVNQWIKRLQLDFSDIFQEGLTFNSIKGNFVVNRGKAITNNLVVDAVPAKIVLSGETDLVRRTVDQIVDVTPKSADALPIAGTIMGKVSSFVAKSLTGAEQEGFFFGSQYHLTGEWGNVQIESLPENDGLLQKTWNGITHFPWLETTKKSNEKDHD